VSPGLWQRSWAKAFTDEKEENKMNWGKPFQVKRSWMEVFADEKEEIFALIVPEGIGIFGRN